MKLTLSISSFAAALTAAALLTGCGSVGYYPGPGRGGHGPDGRYDQRFGDLRGTVSRVDTRNRIIVVDREETGGRYDLRNGNGDDGRQAYLSYDDSTTVSFQGRTFAPEDLEAGDRIAANVDQADQDDQNDRYDLRGPYDRDGDRLFARDIQVLYDVSSGNGTTRDDDGWDRADRDRDDRDRDDRGDRDDREERGATDLRGTVRSLDTRNHTLEIDRSGDDRSGDVLLVRYDEDTEVQYQGRRYSPENLERGDVVEIDVRRDGGGDLLAQEIVVVSNGASR